MSTNGQLEVVGGGANLQVEVRGQLFDCLITKTHDGWTVNVRGTHTNEEVEYPIAETWASAYRRAMRTADGMAPFRSHEKPRKRAR